MYNEQEYLSMIEDTSKLVAQEKATNLSNAVVSFNQSANLANEVEFWNWLGKNYPKHLGSTELIQQTAREKARWLNTQLQGKGYEWDYMAMQRMKPDKVLSVFEAGDCPTQPGIDITETGLLDGNVKATYQNKAYLSSNNPNLSNTPKDAIVVANDEKIAYAKRKGYTTESYMDADEIAEIRDSRFDDALQGKSNTSYTLSNIATASVKAGAVGAVIGMTTETIISYRAWKDGQISDDEYLKEVLKAGGDAGVTAGATTAIMIPVQSAITVAGASNLLTFPVAIVMGAAVNNIVAPCFGRGKYRQILQDAKYYQSLEYVYDDFIQIVENTSEKYAEYIFNMQVQKNQHETMKKASMKMNESLKDLYDSI